MKSCMLTLVLELVMATLPITTDARWNEIS